MLRGMGGTISCARPLVGVCSLAGGCFVVRPPYASNQPRARNRIGSDATDRRSCGKPATALSLALWLSGSVAAGVSFKLMVQQSSAWCYVCGQQRLFEKQGLSYVLHLFLDVFTLGLWLLVWFVLGIFSDAKRPRCATCGTKLGYRPPEPVEVEAGEAEPPMHQPGERAWIPEGDDEP
jgi:hypothetical protein